MVPVWTETPPTRRPFSTTSTDLPSLAAWIAARRPAGPLPMTMKSYVPMATVPRRRVRRTISGQPMNWDGFLSLSPRNCRKDSPRARLGMQAIDTPEHNKSVVRKFLEAMPARDLRAIGECLAEDVVQHYQRPTIQNDDGSQSATFLKGRDSILAEIETYYYRLYRPGTIRVTIEGMVAEGDFVAARFILAAITTR